MKLKHYTLLGFMAIFATLVASCARHDDGDEVRSGGSDERSSEYITTSTDSRYVQNIAMYQSVRNARAGKVCIKFKRDVAPVVRAAAVDVRAAGVAGGAVRTGVASVDAACASLPGVRVERLFPYSAKHDERHRAAGLDLWYTVTYDSAADDLDGLSRAVRSFSVLPEVEYVETVKRVHLIDDSPMVAADMRGPKVDGRSTGSRAAVPFDDPLLNLQWHYAPGSGLPEAVPGADINLFEAWKQSTGDRSVIVCVVDEGIDYTHEDLAANMWTNEGEIPDNDIDDDQNGYVDDVHGYNFVMGMPEVRPNPLGHGTHVAGTVGAVNGNGKGGCGVAGGSGKGDGIRMISAQIFDDAGFAEGTYNAKAIAYGADNGAVISQNSWGMGPDETQKAIEEAIDYFIAQAGRKDVFPQSPMEGGIFIAATGNANTTVPYFPASYGPVLSVSATNHLLAKAQYSNYGPWVDMVAPGGDVKLGNNTGVYSTVPGNKYMYKSGTSMACPHVSGVAALIVSQAKGNINPERVRNQILASCTSIKETDASYYKFLGVGMMNAAKVFASNDEKAPATITDLELRGVDGIFDLLFTVPADENDEVASFVIYYSEGGIRQATLAADLASGAVKSIMVKNVDAVGAKVTFSINTNISGLATAMLGRGYGFAVVALDPWGNAAELSNLAFHSVIADNLIGVSGSNIVRDQVTITLGRDFDGATVYVRDVAGRELRKVVANGRVAVLAVADFAVGQYVVTAVAGSNSSSVRFRKF